jgi:hypothetical protein
MPTFYASHVCGTFPLEPVNLELHQVLPAPTRPASLVTNLVALSAIGTPRTPRALDAGTTRTCQPISADFPYSLVPRDAGRQLSCRRRPQFRPLGRPPSDSDLPRYPMHPSSWRLPSRAGAMGRRRRPSPGNATGSPGVEAYGPTQAGTQYSFSLHVLSVISCSFSSG